MISFFRLFDCVTSSLHAGPKGLVELLYGRSLGSFCLLLLRCLVLSRLPATCRGAHYGTYGCSLACVVIGYGADSCSGSRTTRRTACPLTAARCGT